MENLIFVQEKRSALFTQKICSLFKWKVWLFVHIKDFISVQAKSSALFTLKICSPGQFAQEESSAVFPRKI